MGGGYYNRFYLITWQQLLGETKRQEMIKKELWINDNWLVFKKQQEEETREKLAESTRHKQYRYVIVV